MLGFPPWLQGNAAPQQLRALVYRLFQAFREVMPHLSGLRINASTPGGGGPVV
jgi:hypothetical protein